MFKKKLMLAAIISAMALSAFSCESPSEPSTNESTPATTAAEETTVPEETTTVEETTAVTTEAPTTTAAEETSSAETSDAPTNQEILRAINSAFGIISDGSFEQDIEKAKSWDIINEDEELMADAPATPEFLVSACVRAASFADGTNTMDEIIAVAAEKGIITDTDISKIDMSKADEFISNAAHAWTHQTFETETNVTLADGAVDLNGVITADEWWVEDEYIRMPPSAAEKIRGGDVFILPKKSNGDGGAYKASSVAIVNDEAYIRADKTE